jgi:hypothetical protein
MAKAENMLTLDKPALYRIKVPGKLDPGWADRVEGMVLEVHSEGVDQPYTTLTGILDQASLHGVLRWLYTLGLPLASVICLECGPGEEG